MLFEDEGFGAAFAIEAIIHTPNLGSECREVFSILDQEYYRVCMEEMRRNKLERVPDMGEKVMLGRFYSTSKKGTEKN